MADGDILTGRKPGYLACIDNVPPLIFRFQINPEIMTEKRTFKYDPTPKWGAWDFSKTTASGGALSSLSSITGALDKVKTFAASLVNTAPMESKEGEQRSFAIDFTLDARLADVLDEGDHYGGSIEPDLFVLRSFVNPSLDLIEFGRWALGGFKNFNPASFKPPQCTLVMVGLSVTCVMTDLQIKVTAYGDDGTPVRADVSVTLKEQTASFGPIIEFFQRNINVAKSYTRKNFGTDVMNVTPILNLFT